MTTLSHHHRPNRPQQPEPSVSGTHDHPSRSSYFVSGEIILAPSKGNALPDDWEAQITTPIQEYFRDDKPRFEPLSLEVGNAQLPSLIKIVLPAFTEQRDDSPETVEKKDERFISIVNTLQEDEALKAFTFTPNWLFSCATHSFGHLSPGGQPVPFYPQPGEDKHVFTKDKLNDTVVAHLARRNPKDAVRKAPEEKRENEVNVIILDSAPPQNAIAHFLAMHGSHSFLEQINNRLSIHYLADLPTLLPTPEENERIHYTHRDGYKVSDHGLFIAGTIHDFAPTANLYLIETFNQYGRGSIETIVRAINKIATLGLDPNTPLIVNCSFCIDFLTKAELRAIGFLVGNWKYFSDSARELRALRLALENLIEMFPNTRIIAAAGNDGDEDSTPPARYPAAFDFVIGVGAVDRDGHHAWYSNKPDMPPREGIRVFGGNMNRMGDSHMSDDKHGMIGLYIGEFPGPDLGTSGTPSSTGWASWSGTSFATGVVSGMFAQAAVEGCEIRRDVPENFYETLMTQANPVGDPSGSKIDIVQG